MKVRLGGRTCSLLTNTTVNKRTDALLERYRSTETLLSRRSKAHLGRIFSTESTRLVLSHNLLCQVVRHRSYILCGSRRFINTQSCENIPPILRDFLSHAQAFKV